nr:MAG TPA: hypothetical protein [Caudoviricetes sp.]
MITFWWKGCAFHHGFQSPEGFRTHAHIILLGRQSPVGTGGAGELLPGLGGQGQFLHGVCPGVLGGLLRLIYPQGSIGRQFRKQGGKGRVLADLLQLQPLGKLILPRQLHQFLYRLGKGRFLLGGFLLNRTAFE